MNSVLNTIVAILLMLGLIVFDIFVIIINDIDDFIEKLESKLKDKWAYEEWKEYYEVVYEVWE